MSNHANEQARLVSTVALSLLSLAGIGAAVLSAAACGDVYADPEGIEEPIQPAPRPDAGFGAFPNDLVADCPVNRPRENSLCGPSGTTCEYGKSADMQCNAVLACLGVMGSFATDNSWEARLHDTCRDKVCPTSKVDVGSLDGKPCSIDPDPDGGPITSADEAICNMTDGVCACTTGRDGLTAHERKWVCVRPLSACPTNRPLAGQACSGELWCDYGNCAFKRGLVMECKEGHWLSGGTPCP